MIILIFTGSQLSQAELSDPLIASYVVFVPASAGCMIISLCCTIALDEGSLHMFEKQNNDQSSS